MTIFSIFNYPCSLLNPFAFLVFLYQCEIKFELSLNFTTTSDNLKTLDVALLRRLRSTFYFRHARINHAIFWESVSINKIKGNDRTYFYWIETHFHENFLRLITAILLTFRFSDTYLKRQLRHLPHCFISFVEVLSYTILRVAWATDHTYWLSIASRVNQAVTNFIVQTVSWSLRKQWLQEKFTSETETVSEQCGIMHAEIFLYLSHDFWEILSDVDSDVA